MREVGEFLPRIPQLLLPVAFTTVAPVVGLHRETYGGVCRINLVGPYNGFRGLGCTKMDDAIKPRPSGVRKVGPYSPANLNKPPTLG